MMGTSQVAGDCTPGCPLPWGAFRCAVCYRHKTPPKKDGRKQPTHNSLSGFVLGWLSCTITRAHYLQQGTRLCRKGTPHNLRGLQFGCQLPSLGHGMLRRYTNSFKRVHSSSAEQLGCLCAPIQLHRGIRICFDEYQLFLFYQPISPHGSKIQGTKI